MMRISTSSGLFLALWRTVKMVWRKEGNAAIKTAVSPSVGEDACRENGTEILWLQLRVQNKR